MGRSRNFLVTERIVGIWNTKIGGMPLCQMCGRQIKFGDYVRATNRRHKSKYYHWACYEEGSIPILMEGEDG